MNLPSFTFLDEPFGLEEWAYLAVVMDANKGLRAIIGTHVKNEAVFRIVVACLHAAVEKALRAHPMPKTLPGLNAGQVSKQWADGFERSVNNHWPQAVMGERLLKLRLPADVFSRVTSNDLWLHFNVSGTDDRIAFVVRNPVTGTVFDRLRARLN